MSGYPKLSALIRQGAAKRPQAFGAYWTDELAGQADSSVIGTCAIGAAYEAATGRLPGARDANADEQVGGEIFEATGLDINATWPVPNGKTIWSFVTEMNDELRLSREDIAARLEEVGL